MNVYVFVTVKYTRQYDWNWLQTPECS